MLNPLRVLVSGLSRPSSRCCSGYVSRVRFLDRLKHDDEACEAALSDSELMLFHSLQPLLKSNQDRSFSSVSLHSHDVNSLLRKLGADPSIIRDSILIGCTNRGHAHFCLDLTAVDAAVVEKETGGKFVDLRKSFFLLSESEAPLVAKMSPVVIALVHDGSRCLLGRQASFPSGLYSALAGFCDMGESVEEAVRREVAEEAGLEVLSVTYSSSQHWPFPSSSFMIGCFASISPVHTELSVDHLELEDARWFDLSQIEAGLRVQTPPRKKDSAVTWFPPKHAIGHRLISEWARLQRQHMTS